MGNTPGDDQRCYVLTSRLVVDVEVDVKTYSIREALRSVVYKAAFRRL